MITEPHDKAGNGRDIAAHEAAIRRAVLEAVLTHARLGRAVVGWRDGRVVWLSPEQVIEEFAQKPQASP
jgi:hypothetical protein